MQPASFSSVHTSPRSAHEQLAHGTGILATSLVTESHGDRTIVGHDPIAEFAVPRTTPFEKTQPALRLLFDQIEEFSIGSKFCIGFVTYEAMVEMLGLHVRDHHPHLPKAHFFGYDKQGEWESKSQSIADELSIDTKVREPFARTDYLPRCERVLKLIRDGELYQTNLTARCLVESSISPAQLWARLNNTNPVPYAACISLGDTVILSSSPERFFQRRGSELLASPIKGTARLDSGQDAKRVAEQLQSSAKNRAELLMIVDLLRNDLGKISETGSVKVEKLFTTEPYARLVHLVADIRASARPDCTLADIFAALSPGGSITGAPKRRAVEYLVQLEPVPRGVYTGAIGYVSEKQTEFNIAIRTMTCHDNHYELHAGGGIVADSNPEAEFDELLLKASPLLAALGLDMTHT